MSAAAFSPTPLTPSMKIKRQPRGLSTIDVSKPPAELTGRALEEWNRLGGALAESDQLAEIDRNVLANYCVVFGRWAEAEVQVAELGVVVQGPTGTPIANPYLRIADGAIRQLVELAREMGLTPAARGELRKRP